MRILFFFLLLSNFCFTQDGGVFVHCQDGNGNPLKINVRIWQDTALLTTQATNSKGDCIINTLPVGQLTLDLYLDGQPKRLFKEFFVQEKQILQLTEIFDSTTYISTESSALEFSSNGQSFPKRLNSSGQDFQKFSPHALILTGLTLNEVLVMTSTNGIMTSDAGSMCATVMREDISNLPSRNAYEIAGTVGGVNLFDQTDELSMRGSRSDANAFYIDGMRVRNLKGIPKSYIGGVTVIYGGIPANYGDLTGGIVSVKSRSFYEGGYQAYHSPAVRQRYSEENTIYQEPDPIIKRDVFLPIYENTFLSPLINQHSTFGLDVDQASWYFIKRQFKAGLVVPRDAVKMEELINSFPYNTVKVPEGELMNVVLERSTCIWSDSSELLVVNLKAKDLPLDIPRINHNIVFLIDVSGSMASADKLELLKLGMCDFVESLNDKDRIAIVVYAGAAGVVLEPTACDDKSKILQAMDRLSSGGSTNGIGGIMQAYALAEANYDPSLNNRIILCTDGDFNVGIHSTSELEAYIAQKRGSGIYLTALGFGMGNYRNDILETLADRGDGNHFYIRNIEDCRKVLISDLGNLINIARDVKLNVEFNPKYVKSYRLIGYENRLLCPEDFIDDTKDAGEIGYSHRVTAVYEIIPERRIVLNSNSGHYSYDPNELVHVKLRYKSFEDTASVERSFSLNNDCDYAENALLNLVSSFGLYLRNSIYRGAIDELFLIEYANLLHLRGSDEKELAAMILSLKK